MFSSPGTAAASGGSFLKNLTNPTAISGFLNNTQQVLSAFQQITPLVSQYGPIIKNIPTMWKLYRGLKDATEETNSEQTEMESIELEEESVEKEEVLTTERRSSFLTGEEQTKRRKQSKNQNHRSVTVNSNDEDTESDEDDWDKPGRTA
ncbi:VrrA/YqfQ family protein [Bacillus sp. T3]|uniref:VrrA/YqfQ family protein n=1 Tax=Bacillus sp. T3 TaxID=467262 RepID=UPI0029819DA7|nr:VrrA/YqfQ family protein [Bacillus sp. T3]